MGWNRRSTKEVALPGKRGALSRNSAQTTRRRGDGFLRREGAELVFCFFFLFLLTCPPEILSAASSAPGALTDSETKTPQPRCSARPRPLFLKGQQPGWRRRRWRKEVVVGGFLSSHMGAFTSHVRSIRLPSRIHISSSAPKEESPN